MRRSAITLDAEMSAEESATLDRILQSAKLSGPHLEIGTAAGGTLKRMMSNYPKERRPKFVVVDTMDYFPDQKSIVVRNLETANISASEVDFRIGRSSIEFAKAERARERFDFILIDASHKFNHVTNDLRWTRLLNLGGYVCMHDYSSQFPGVTEAADRFLARHTNYRRVEATGSILVLRKDGPSPLLEITIRDRWYAEAKTIWRNLRGSIGKRIRKIAM